MSLYDHAPHPHIEHRKKAGPVKTDRHRFAGKGALGSLNALIGLRITMLVGTMMAAYLFAAIALISLPSAIKSGNLTIIVAWASSNFIQLVLLPVIIVGQNVQAKAADARAESTYKDAEAVLAEALKIQEHLAAQDGVLTAQEEKLAGLADKLSALVLSAQAKPAPRARAKPGATT